MKIFILKLGLLHAAAFVLDCCITKYSKFSSSKLHLLISSQVCRSRVWIQCDWVLCSRSRKDKFQVSVGVMCLFGGPGGESTPKLTPTGRRIQFLASLRLEPLSFFSLLAGGHSQLLEATHIPCPMASSIPKTANGDFFMLWIFLLWISLTFLDSDI